jgi:hypothetical protein
VEFLARHQIHRRPRGVEILVNKRVAHEDFLATLERPFALWDGGGIAIDREGKNRLGHGPMRVGLATVEVFLKEFLPKSAFDSALSIFKPSRAAASFLAGLELRRRDLLTPEPLAAVTVRRAGSVRRSWLMTEWLGAVPSLREVMDRPERHGTLLGIWPWERLLEALGRLLRAMHDAHVVHRDLSLRNVLVEPPGESPPREPRLWLIDLNRALALDADHWSPRRSAVNFQRLRLSGEDFDRVLRAHFPDPPEYDANRELFERMRERHVAYKRLKKIPRRSL